MINILEKYYKYLEKNESHLFCVDDDKQYTRKEVEELSGRIFNYLRINKIGKEDFVLIYLPRNSKIYISMLGVLKAGAAFVCFEEGSPKERVEFVKKELNCSCIIDTESFEAIINTPYLKGYEKTELHDAAYAVYTSGTTGIPKGIIHEYGDYQKAITSSLIDEENIRHNENTRFAVLCSLNFIAAVYVLPCLLYSGATIYLPKTEVVKNPQKLLEYFSTNKINQTFIVPSLLRYIGQRLNSEMEYVITGSEKATGIRINHGRLVNYYMMSECGFVIAYNEVDENCEIKSVGKASKDVEIKFGKENEVIVYNPYCRGYINDEDLNKESFNDGYFKTDDIGELDDCGNLSLKGRFKDMFKINGNRVEPEEIENVVKRLENIDCVAKGFIDSNNQTIALFYVSENKINEDLLREKLIDILPNYMIPNIYIKIDKIPLTSMGKIDRKSLKLPKMEKEEIINPRNDLEKQFVNVIKKILKINELGINNDIFNLGMDSIKVIEAIEKLNINGLESRCFYAGRTIEKIINTYKKNNTSNLTEEEKEIEGRKKGFGFITGSDERVAMANAKYIPYTGLNLPVAYRLSKLININKLKDIMNDYMKKSSLFNITLRINENGEVRQTYAPELFKPIEVENVDENYISELSKTFVQPFVLLDSLPYRIRLLKTKKYNYLFFDIHHFIIDGEGIKLIFEDIINLYFGKKINSTSNYFAYLYDKEISFNSPLCKEGLKIFTQDIRITDYVGTVNDNEEERDIEDISIYRKTDIRIEDITEFSEKYNYSRAVIDNVAEIITLYKLTHKCNLLSNYMSSNRVGNHNHTGYRAVMQPVAINLTENETLKDILQEIKKQIERNLIYPDINGNYSHDGKDSAIVIDDLADIENIPSIAAKLVERIDLDKPFNSMGKVAKVEKYLQILNDGKYISLRFNCDNTFIGEKMRNIYLDTFIQSVKTIISADFDRNIKDK